MTEQSEQTEINEDELLRQLMFSDLMTSKVDVRSTCPQCDGRGVKFGEKCQVCDGDKVVTQSMSLYNVAKKMLPFFAHEFKALLASLATG